MNDIRGEFVCDFSKIFGLGKGLWDFFDAAGEGAGIGSDAKFLAGFVDIGTFWSGYSEVEVLA